MNRVIKFRAWYKKDGGYMLSSAEMQTGITGSLDEYFIDPDYNFMQFTGLHDVNGVEIYESDIVRDTEEYGLGLVEFKKYGWCFDSCESLHDWDGMLEIVGNIHQNPELLESAK